MNSKKTVFVAHAFTPAELADLRSAIDSAFTDTEFQALYADTELVDGHILDRKIRPQIERSDVFFCEISDHSRASVFVEYGLAKGSHKPCVLLLRSGSAAPADLKGYDRVEYTSYAQLTEILRTRLPGIRTLLADSGHGPHRVALICSTTTEIESDPTKTKALSRFYRHLFAEFERVPLCVNTCGAEPLRQAFLDGYAKKLRHWSAEQMRSFEPKVRWYWHRTARYGFSRRPPFFESFECADRQSRTIDEALASSAIVAFTGRTGTREQVERLLAAHEQKDYDIDLKRRPLILLSWFGGTVAALVRQRGTKLDWLLQTYKDLEPRREFDSWWSEKRIPELANKLVTGVHRVLGHLGGV